MQNFVMAIVTLMFRIRDSSLLGCTQYLTIEDVESCEREIRTNWEWQNMMSQILRNASKTMFGDERERG